jgi:hypothetical protein
MLLCDLQGAVSACTSHCNCCLPHAFVQAGLQHQAVPCMPQWHMQQQARSVHTTFGLLASVLCITRPSKHMAIGPDSCRCTAALPAVPAVSSGPSVVVTCQKPNTGTWPEGSFTVTLSATANTPLAGCSHQNSTTTTVTVNKLPVLAVQVQAQDFAVCQTDDSFNLTYTVGTGASGLPSSVITSETCSVTPNSAGATCCLDLSSSEKVLLQERPRAVWPS